MPTLTDFLTDEDRAAIRAPIAEARTFPQIAYRSQDFFEFEVANLFSGNWVAVGFAGQPVPRSATWRRSKSLAFLLMTRAEDQAIRIFHNIGAHDGCPIALTRQARVTTLEAPYHGWQYSLRGELVKAPFWDGTPNPDPLPLRKRGADLKEIRCGVWNDIIFMDLSGRCAPLPVFLAPLIALFADFDFSTLEMAHDSADGDGIHRFHARANWKPLWENYAPNVYHEGFVHEQYRRSAHVPRVDALGDRTFHEINGGIVKGLAFETAGVGHDFTPMSTFSRIQIENDGFGGHPIFHLEYLSRSRHVPGLSYPCTRVGILVPEDVGNSRWLIASYYTDGSALEIRRTSRCGSAVSRLLGARELRTIGYARPCSGRDVRRLFGPTFIRRIGTKCTMTSTRWFSMTWSEVPALDCAGFPHQRHGDVADNDREGPGLSQRFQSRISWLPS